MFMYYIKCIINPIVFHSDKVSMINRSTIIIKLSIVFWNLYISSNYFNILHFYFLISIELSIRRIKYDSFIPFNFSWFTITSFSYMVIHGINSYISKGQILHLICTIYFSEIINDTSFIVIIGITFTISYIWCFKPDHIYITTKINNRIPFPLSDNFNKFHSRIILMKYRRKRLTNRIDLFIIPNIKYRKVVLIQITFSINLIVIFFII